MTAVLATPPFLQFVDEDGLPLSGYELHTFAAGTLNRKATYTDASATVEKTNPIVLDSAGRATFWIDGSYKYILTPAGGDLSDPEAITVDNITNFNTLADAVSPLFDTFAGNGTQTVFTLSEDAGTASENLLVFIDYKRPEYIRNGDFASDTIWTKGSGWTIGTGVATATGAISTAISQTSGIIDLISGVTYTITYTITRSAGDLIPSIGGTAGTTRSASGTYTESIVCGATQVIAFTGAGFTGTIDNVSMKAIYDKGFDVQDPSLYSVSGTTLTFANAPLDGSLVYVFAPSLLLGAASASASAAAASAASASGYATDAEEWAIKTDGIVDSTDYSSKAYAIGGTGTTTNNAKYYSQQASSSATSASGYATSAQGYATAASNSATDASNYATQVLNAKLIWKGTYSGSTTYAVNDAVTYNGSSFICKLASTGNAPAVGGTTYWDDLANKGADGSLADGDYTDIVVSSSGTVMKLQPDAITGQPAATIASGDSIVFSDVSDSGNLKKVDLLGTAHTYAGAQRQINVTLTDGATITPDFALGNNFNVVLGGNRTLGMPNNIVAAQSFNIDFIQDVTGSRTLAYAWGYHFSGGTASVLSTAGCSTDTLYGDVKVYKQSAVTISIATPAVVSYTAHGLVTGQRVQITTTGALPTGLTASTSYYVIVNDADSFWLATSLANAAAGTKIATSGSQSGVHTLTACRINASLGIKGAA